MCIRDSAETGGVAGVVVADGPWARDVPVGPAPTAAGASPTPAVPVAAEDAVTGVVGQESPECGAAAATGLCAAVVVSATTLAATTRTTAAVTE